MPVPAFLQAWTLGVGVREMLKFHSFLLSFGLPLPVVKKVRNGQRGVASVFAAANPEFGLEWYSLP